MDQFTFNNPHVLDLLEKLKKKDGHIDDEKCDRLTHQLKNEEAVAPLREAIRKEYTNLLRNEGIVECTEAWQDKVSFLPDALQKACYEIETDLRILFSRRKNLIGVDENTGISLISIGKIAGVTTYRLAKAHIIHLSSHCVNCYQNKVDNKSARCSVPTLNTKLAIISGLRLIGKSYAEIQDDIRNEILYTLINRHTNQETLGVIFDTLKVK